MNSGDDLDRVRRAKAGDTSAFGELVLEHERVVFNLALRMVHDREDARDLAQTVFIKAYRALNGFDERHKFFSWIYRITINESLNFLERRRQTTPLDESMVSTDPRPDERHRDTRLEDIVQQELTGLTEEYRQVILLRHFLNRTYQEMSEMLGIPEKTIKSRLYTARQRLGEKLKRRGITHA